MNIPSKNNNQSSVHVALPRNKVSNQLSVKDHVSSNDKDVSMPKNKDVSIPKNKDVSIPKNKDIDIPQNEDIHIPSKIINNHQFMLKFLITKYLIDY